MSESHDGSQMPSASDRLPDGPLATARRVLVTGGAGFVGRHLVRLLVSRGIEVVVFDDFSTGSEAQFDVGGVEVVRASILDRESLEQAMDRANLVFHLAAVVGVERVLDDPLRALEVNGRGTESVFAAAAERSLPVVYASSSEVYGTNPNPPSRETDPVVAGVTDDPRGGYACTKAYGEWLGQARALKNQLPVLTVRLFNTVGPGQSGSGGMVLPRFVDAALAGRPLVVHGDGRQARCFADVREVVRAIADLASHRSAFGRVFNVGSSEEVAILDLARAVREEVVREEGGSGSEIIHAATPRPSDPRRRIPCLDRLAAEIGWVPQTAWRDLVRAVVGDRVGQATDGPATHGQMADQSPSATGRA